jgi:hypothetical protein
MVDKVSNPSGLVEAIDTIGLATDLPVGTVIREGETRAADDPFVKAHPDLFMPTSLPDPDKHARRQAARGVR